MTAADAAMISNMRLWDSGTSWMSVEKFKGQYDWSMLDIRVQEAQTAGQKILLTLGSTPQWASSKPTEVCPYGLGCAAPPSDINDWRTYVRAVVARYRGRIECYEPWNEASFPGDTSVGTAGEQGDPNQFFSGTAAQLVQLSSVVYAEVKAGDPAACVTSPSFHPSGNWSKKFNAFMSAGGVPYFDAVSWHFYFTPIQPELVTGDMDMVKSKLTQYGVGSRPVWNTELGQSFEELSQKGSNSIVELIHSTMLRSAIINKWKKVSRMYWYSWDHDVMGIGPVSTGVGAASASMKDLQTLVENITAASCTTSSDLWTCTGTLSNSNTFEARWSTSSSSSRTWTVDKSASKWLGAANVTYQAGQTVAVDSRPVVVIR